MSKGKKTTTSVALSIFVHSLLALAIVRTGLKYAFPEAAVTSESVSFETVGDSTKQDAAEKIPVPTKSSKGGVHTRQATAQKNEPKFMPVKEFNDVVPEDKKEEEKEADKPVAPIVVPPPPAQAKEEAKVEVKEEVKEEPKEVAKEVPQALPEAGHEAAAPPKEEAAEAGAEEAAASDEKNGGTQAPQQVGSQGRPMDAEKLQEVSGNSVPEYSRMDRLLRREGTVTLLAYIKSDGSVDLPIVQKSSGHPSLDRAAVNAYSKWRYKPGTTGYAIKSFRFHIKP